MATKKIPLAGAIAGAIAGASAPAKVQMPKAVAELHVGPDEGDVIPAGTVITDEVATVAGLDPDAIERLEVLGHVTFVEVYAAIDAAPDQAGA